MGGLDCLTKRARRPHHLSEGRAVSRAAPVTDRASMKMCLMAGCRLRIRSSRRAMADVLSCADIGDANSTSIVRSTVRGPKYMVRGF